MTDAAVAPRGVSRRDWRWIAVATVVAVAVPAAETRLREIQSALLLYFLASFWLALPRRTSSWLLLAMTSAAPFVVQALVGTPENWSALATLGAVVLGTIAGTVAGSSFRALDAPLDGTAGVDETPRTPSAPASLRSRVVLSLALTAFAALGLAPVWASVRTGGRVLGLVPVPAIAVSLIAARWAQALTLVGWVLVVPTLVARRPRLRTPDDGGSSGGITAGELAQNLAVVAALLAIHAFALAVLGVMMASRAQLFLAAEPRLVDLWLATAAAYAPFDLLTYIAILGLAHLSDRARQAEDARRRAVALEATAVTARLEALRSRLDPHFLYNALNAAVTLARRGEGDETSRVLEELTALLRYVLDDRRAWVPLHEELAFVRRYLGIMQLRFGPRLAYAITADEQVTDVRVPSLLLQPLVENAVEHGVARAAGPVAIRIAARMINGHLNLIVEDDGVGPNAAASAGSGIGLGHTRERLAMLFGGDASLTLSPGTPRGAITRVVLPVSSSVAVT